MHMRVTRWAKVALVVLLLTAPALGQDYAGVLKDYQQRLIALKAERADLATRADQLDVGIAQLEGAMAAAGELQKQAAQAAAVEAAKANEAE